MHAGAGGAGGAGGAAAMGAALLAHDRIKRSTELPLYFGNKNRDTISAPALLDRINVAAEIATWNPARRCQEFYMILRDRALVWWDTLDDIEGVDKQNWDHVSREFRNAYAPKFSAKTNCTNFSELYQRSGESVQDFYLRVAEAFKNMTDAKPDFINAIRTPDANPRAEVKAEGVTDMARFFLNQLFLAGLKEEIRLRTMESGPERIHISVETAREIETILADKKGGAKGTVINAIAPEGHNAPPEQFDDDEVEAINAIRAKKGKRPFRPNNGSNGNRPKPKCHYCKKPGHIQKYCYTRIAEKGEYKDAQGRPMTKKVYSVQNTDETSKAANDPGEDYYRLSSIGEQSLNY